MQHSTPDVPRSVASPFCNRPPPQINHNLYWPPALASPVGKNADTGRAPAHPGPVIPEEFNAPMGRALEQAMKILLSQKHLYQAIELDLAFVPELVKKNLRPNPRSPSVFGGSSGPDVDEELKREIERARSMARATWSPYILADRAPQQIPGTGTGSGPIMFQLPTVNTYCDHCEGSPPFNPVADGSYCVISPKEHGVYYLAYMCQQCKEHEVFFLVRREGLKLRLCGRDPVEMIPPPSFLPKPHRRHYSDAVIAHHAGQTLAGIFLLRVFVEQFWRSRQEVKDLIAQDPRITGERMGEAYQATLPKDFRDHFPSLSEVYSHMSAAMHAAASDAQVFEDSRQKIEEHFDARRLFKL